MPEQPATCPDYVFRRRSVTSVSHAHLSLTARPQNARSFFTEQHGADAVRHLSTAAVCRGTPRPQRLFPEAGIGNDRCVPSVPVILLNERGMGVPEFTGSG